MDSSEFKDLVFDLNAVGLMLMDETGQKIGRNNGPQSSERADERYRRGRAAERGDMQGDTDAIRTDFRAHAHAVGGDYDAEGSYRLHVMVARQATQAAAQEIHKVRDKIDWWLDLYCRHVAADIRSCVTAALLVASDTAAEMESWFQLTETCEDWFDPLPVISALAEKLMGFHNRIKIARFSLKGHTAVPQDVPRGWHDASLDALWCLENETLRASEALRAREKQTLADQRQAAARQIAARDADR